MAVFSAVFSLTVLSGLLFLLIDFFPVLLSMANKDSFIRFIHSFIHSFINSKLKIRFYHKIQVTFVIPFLFRLYLRTVVEGLDVCSFNYKQGRF